MAIIDLSNVLKIFGGGKDSPEQHKDLVKEVLLMTLSRASSSDSNTHPCEIATVQKVLKDVTGEDISAADIRVAAASELYERAPLEKYLSGVAPSLSRQDRVTVSNSLATVIKSDVKVNPQEAKFFNEVVAALGISPAEVAGLVA
jgi:uncharacterized tellurite resistance protein B-like protein